MDDPTRRSARRCHAPLVALAMTLTLALAPIGCATDTEADDPPVSAVERLLDPVEPAEPAPGSGPAPDEPVIPATPPDAGPIADDAAAPMDLAEFDRRWSALLGRAVHPRTGRVDYAYLADRIDELRTLVRALGPAREFADDRAKLAFTINAYNLLVVTGVIEGRPRSTVRDIDGFFDKRTRRVLGADVTLDDLRDRVIRPMGDARVHGALCYGAMGSPSLRPSAFTADALDEQLNAASIAFVNDPTRNSAVGGSLLLNPVFKWFAPDFAADPYRSAVGFIRLFAEPDGALDRLTAGGDPAVEYLEFNWALNAR